MRLERRGLRVIEPVVDPLEDKVVDSVAMLPFVPECAYGFPLASVTDTLPPGKKTSSYMLQEQREC